MSNGYWVSKDGLRIPKRDNAQRKQWDAGYLARLKDYFGDDKDNDYEPALLPVADIESNHSVFESNPRIPFYSRLYRQNVHEVPPILVTQSADGRYQMRDGNHRHAAARRAGVSHIPALIQRPKKSTKTKSSTPHVFTGTKVKKLKKSSTDSANLQLVGLLTTKGENAHKVMGDMLPSMFKAEDSILDLSKHERETPPELPKRIQRAMWALHQPGVLTDELRQPKYRSDPNPLAGHCFVATNALFHLINGPKTGWDMKCIHREHLKDVGDDTHWFLQHRKTGHILDPTADQFDVVPPYEQGVSKGTSQTGEDVGKPTKRAQVVIDRAKAVMSEAPKEYLGTLQHDGQQWYIQPPEMKKAEEKRISLDDAHKLYGWFHISHQEPDENGQFRAEPRVPGLNSIPSEDKTTPRICVGPSIHHCVAGLLSAEPGDDEMVERIASDPSMVNTFRGRHVYGVPKRAKVVIPTREQVPDAPETGEGWLTKPTTLRHIGRLDAEQRGNTIPSLGEPFLSKAEPLAKAIVPGVMTSASENNLAQEWDYSHLLPQKTRDEGYRIRLRVNRYVGGGYEGQGHFTILANKTQDNRTRPAGTLSAQFRDKVVQPHEIRVEEQDRRKRLGMAMYEALYAHSRGQLGLTHVDGDVHSTASHLVHKKLSTKHGLDYSAKKNIQPRGGAARYRDEDEWLDTPAHDVDAKYGEYKYKLPDVMEPKQVNSFAEHKLPGMLHAEGYRLNIAHSPDTTIGTIHRRGEVVGHIELTPKGHAFEEWTGESNRVGLRDATLSVLRGHQGGEAGHDEWNNVSKRLPVAKSASGSPNLLKHEDLHALPGAQGQVGVRNPNGQGQGVPEVALQGMCGGGVGGVLRAQPREGGGAPLSFQPQAVRRADGVPANAQGGNRDMAGRPEACAEGADGRPEVGSVHGLQAHVPAVRDGLGPHGLLAKAGERGQHGGQAGQLGSDTGGDSEVRPRVLELPPGQDSHPTPHGSHITKPHLTYTHGAAAKPFGTEYEGGKNVWARNSPDESNKGRTLMVQFSTHLLQGGRKPDEADSYYDKLYSKREGYHRGQDWWEVPQWQGHLAHNAPAADHYTVRDPEEAIKFMNAAGYDHVAFSALDVNKDFVRRLASGAPNQHVVVGGYTDMNHFGDLKNVSVHPSIKSFVESEGQTYQPGYDYRHFTGMKTLPRLTLSDGCRHQCTFCCVPKQVDEKSREEILQQADAFAAHLPSDLIYLNDKTFGQAKNHAMLPELYQRIKAKNPAFKGFVIQTTAAQMKRFTPEYLKAAGIKHVELGVESVNDPILKAHKKPATEAIIEDAANKVRAAGASLIPNIMVGLPGEDRTTYGRTLAWLQKHRDIISHVNAYNLALYDDSELGKKLQVINDADRDENVQAKSWHTDPQAHADFAKALFGFANGQLDQPIGHGQELSKTTMEQRIKSQHQRRPEQAPCPKCGDKKKHMEMHGEPVFVCDACEHKWEVPFPADLENSDIGHDGVTKDMVKADKPFIKSPAFRHASSGKVIATPILHDREILARKLKVHPDHPSLYNDWEAGYIDHANNFYDREAALAAVMKPGQEPTPKASYLEDIPGLESEQYASGRERGVFKAEEGGSISYHVQTLGDGLEAEDGSPESVRAVAMLGGREVGRISLRPHGRGLRCMGVGVHPNFQRQGVATRLVDEVKAKTGMEVHFQAPKYRTPEGHAFVGAYMSKAEVDHHDPVSCVVMVQDGLGRTLWGKRKDGKYTMPAGHADAHEHPADCATRELMEEAGLKAEALWLIGSGNGGEGPVHVYHAISHGQPRTDLDPDREMASWEWVDCLRGPPERITANLAHNPNVVYTLMGWRQPSDAPAAPQEGAEVAGGGSEGQEP